MEQVPRRLPSYWHRSLKEGRLYTALLLSTVFSEKYTGRNLIEGQVAEIKLPTASDLVTFEPGEVRTVRPTLLFRAGFLEASPFVWRGDETAQDATLYVCFGPLRKKRQFMKILSLGTLLEKDVVCSTNGAQVIRISGYIKSLLDRLWTEDRVGERLTKAVADHPGHRVLFAGLSHGAVLAQAAALRFALQCGTENRTSPREGGPRLPLVDGAPRGGGITCVSWNGYKWTDLDGAELAARRLNILPFALSMKTDQGNRCVDSVVEYPRGEFSAIPGVTAMDRDTGAFFDCQIGNSHKNLEGMDRMRQLHFAQAVLKAMKMAMIASLADRASSADEIELIISRAMSHRPVLSRRLTAEESFMTIPDVDVDSDDTEDADAHAFRSL